MIRFPGIPQTRANNPRRVFFGNLKYITECGQFVGFGDTRQESFNAWKEARDKPTQSDQNKE